MILSLLLALQLTPAQVEVKPSVKPNLLVIVLDDVGVDQVGCYAANYPALDMRPCTPNIDALADSGMRFTNAWASPVCSPSRALILTGRPARHTGVGTVTEPDAPVPNHGTPDFSNGLQIGEPTLASLLPQYPSAAIGKWHVSDAVIDGSGFQHPIDLGFGSFSGSLYNLEGDYGAWLKTTYPDGGQVSAYPVYATVDTAQEAAALAQSLPEPWLLYVAFNAAHTPLHCPSQMGIAPADCPGGCVQNWCQACAASGPALSCESTWGVEACQSRAMVQALDGQIGELLSATDVLDTAVVLISDNGTGRRPTVPPFVKNHSKGTYYQGGINVPLIVRVPGGEQGVCHELVSATDIYATLADLAGVHPPPDPLRDSVSLCQYVAPAKCLSAATPRQHVFTEFFGPNFLPDASGQPPPEWRAGFDLRAVRNATHKLMERRWWHAGTASCQIGLEFYRLSEGGPQDPAAGPDPFEENDLMKQTTSWKHADSQAFLELSELLDESYPPLPTGACP